MRHVSTEGVEFESTEPVKGASVRAWCVKDNLGLVSNVLGFCWEEAKRQRERMGRFGEIVPVEITEIVEGKSVEKEPESKEPNWKAMWKDLRGVVAQWSEPKYWLLILEEIERRHTFKRETLKDVVREFIAHEDGDTYDAQNRRALMNQMRELTKETK